MRACILQNPESLHDLRKDAGGLSDISFLPLSWGARRALEREGLKILSVRDLVDPHADAIMRQCESLSGLWFRDEQGEDVTSFEGISLASVYHAVVCIVVVLPAVKHFATAHLLLETGAREIWCDASAPLFLRRSLDVWREGNYRKFGETGTASRMSEAMGPAIAWHPPSPSIWREGILETFFSGLARALRLLRGNRGGVPVLAQYYPTFDRLFAALTSFPWDGRFRLATVNRPGRRLLARYLWKGIPIASAFFDSADQETKDQAFALLVRWRTVAEHAANRPEFRLFGKSLWPVVREGLDEFLRENLAAGIQLARYSARILSRHRSRWLLLPQDNMPAERALVEQARRIGVKSVVVTHGIGFVFRWLGEGLQADYAAADGAGSRRALVREGRKADTVWAGGAGLIGNRREGPPPLSLRNRVLVLTNPPGPLWPHSYPGDAENYLVRVLTLLSSFEGVQSTVKLHPAESAEYYTGFLKEAGFSHIPVVRDRPFSEVLEKNGVVIGTASTALLEAMAARRWVTGVNWTGDPLPSPYDGQSGLPVMRSEAALRAWIESVLSEQPPATDYSTVLEDYAGPAGWDSPARLLDRLWRESSDERPEKAGASA